MKRIWFAIIFLAISVGLSASEQMYVKKVYNDLNTMISEYSEYNDFADMLKGISNIEEYWDANNDLLFSIEDSNTLDDLGFAIYKLEANKANYKKTMKEIEMISRFFYRNQRVTLANIF